MPQQPRQLNPYASALAFFGAELRHWRGERTLSQAELGRLVHVSGALIAKIEKAERRPSPDLVRRLDTTLETSGVLGRLGALIERAAGGGNGGPGAPALLEEWGAAEDDLTAAARASADFLEWAEASNIGDLTIEQLHQQIASMGRRYVHAPMLPIYAQMLHTRDHLMGLLRGTQPLGRRRELMVLTGAVLGLMAHACDDLGDATAAGTHARAALACAQQAGHPELAAWITGTMSKIYTVRGEHEAAALLARQTQAALQDGHGMNRLAALEARAWAQAGAQEEALNALAVARAATAEREGSELTDWGGIFTFPAPKLEFYSACVNLWLGQGQQTSQHAQAAIEAYVSGPAQDRSYGDEICARADLVGAHLLERDAAAATEALEPLLELTPERTVVGLTRHLWHAQAILGTLPRAAQPKALREGIEHVLGISIQPRQ